MMRITVAILALLPPALALPRHNIQNLANLGKRDRPSIEERRQAVIDVFRFSWDGYYTHAFPHDELRPVTNAWGDSR